MRTVRNRALIVLACMAVCLAQRTGLQAQVVDAVVAPARAVKAAPAQPGAPNQPTQPGAQGKPAAAAPLVTLTNIEDKQFQAPQAEFQDGKLTVKSDPPQTVALNELQRAVFAHETKLAVEWIGQENRDLVQVGSADGGNGIRDVHIRASGLTAKNLRQVAIISRPQFRVWRQDVARSPYWKIATERIGQASVADFYFEPPTRDLFETDLELTLTFDDNSTAKATLKATGHTSDQTAVETPADGAPPNPHRLATLELEGGDTLRGRILHGNADQIAVETAWHRTFEVPILQIRGVLFDGGKPEVKTKYDAQLAKPGENDYVVVLSKDGGLAEITGNLQSVSETGLKILYEGQERSIKLERVQAVVLAGHPPTRTWKGPFQVFRLASGDKLSANWLTWGETACQIKSAWGVDIEVPREAIVEVTGRNTKMINLSELTPLSIEQVPYFDRILPWVRDKSWNNRPLKLAGKTYNRGLALHSRCVLTYDLAGEFATFRALVGFDEEAGERGRVTCRVSVDDQELFAKANFLATDKPLTVEVPVKGAKVLRVEVDFGDDEDAGDRVIWANARLYRE